MSFPTTPVTVGLYHRMMMDLFNEKEIIGVPTGFQAMFGRIENGSKTIMSPDSLEIDLDIVRGNEKIAALIPRGTLSRPVESFKDTRKEKFTERNLIFPLAEEHGSISANELYYRSVGENPYAARSQIERLRDKARDYHKEHVRRFVRTNELLAATVVKTGKMPGIVGTTDTNLIYDFKRKSTHTTTAAASWATAGTDILTDIDTLCELVRQDAHVTPDIAIAGSTAMSGIMNNTAIKAQLDNRSIDAGLIQVGYDLPQRLAHMPANGFIPRGLLTTTKGHTLYLFTYLDGYDNSAGTYTQYVSATDFIVTSSMARMDRAFGPGERLPMLPQEEEFFAQMFGFSTTAGPMPENSPNISGIVDPRMFFNDVLIGEDRKAVTIRTQHAPLFIPTMVDAVAFMDVTP